MQIKKLLWLNYPKKKFSGQKLNGNPTAGSVAYPVRGCISLTSFIIDLNDHRADWFARSGAVSAIIGIVLASRSIKKHNQKFFSNIERNDLGKEMLHTSIPQLKIDKWTLVLSIIGTLIWAYGDKVIELFLE
jgi:hypothetical protein